MSETYKIKEKTKRSLPEMEKQILEIINFNGKALSKDDAKSLLKNISSYTNMTFELRSVILCLTLKLIYGERYDSYVRYAFGMIRGLFKDFLRSKNKIPSGFRRSPREHSQEIIYQTPTVREHGDYIQRSAKYHKTTIVKTRSKPTSPCSSERSSIITKNSPEKNIRANFSINVMSLKSLQKTFQKFLSKRFNQFRLNSFKDHKNEKSSHLKRFFKILERKMTRNGFDAIRKYQNALAGSRNLSKIPLAKSASTLSDNLIIRSPSFEERDKELWKRRHPIKNHSPTPSDFSAISGPIEPSSGHSSPTSYTENPFWKEKNIERRRSGELADLDSPQREESVKNSKAEDDLKNSRKNIINKPKPKALRSGKNQGKPKELQGIETSSKISFNVKDKEKIKNLLENINENHKYAKKAAVNNMKDAVTSDKTAQKLGAANLISDFISIFQDKISKNLQGQAFESLRDYYPAKLQSTPVFVKKKITLRANNNKNTPEITKKNQKTVTSSSENSLSYENTKEHSITSTKIIKNSPINTRTPSEKGLILEHYQLFADKISVLNHIILKNKLTSFIAILEEEEPINPKILDSFKDIFRILEAKRFSKLFFTFNQLRKVAEKSVHLRKAKSVHFFQKMNKAFNRISLRNKHTSFKVIKSMKDNKKAALRLFETLYKLRYRISSQYKSHILARIKSFQRCNKLNSNVIRLRLIQFFKKSYLRSFASAFV